MKSIYVVLFFGLLFFNCDGFTDIDEGEKGIRFYLYNYTNVSYEGATFFIGAVVNDRIIVTDSLKTNIEITSLLDPKSNTIYTDDVGKKYVQISARNDDVYLSKGWRPDFDKIKKLSNDYCFKIKLSDGREEVFLIQKNSFDTFTIGSEVVQIRENKLILED